jgi:hypothetical protein
MPKRASSKAAGAARKVAKQCNVIAPAIKAADSLPAPVKSILSGKLVHVFGTYKEERHQFQSTVSALVGKTLKQSETDLKSAITDAEAKKQAAEAEGATLSASSAAAGAASEATAKAVEEGKASLATCNGNLSSAKAELHAAEEAVKKLEADTIKTTAKKEKLEALVNDFVTPLAEGTLSKGLSVGSARAGSLLKDDLEKEFLVCVVRSFSKPRTSWGTFDVLVHTELDGKLKEILAALASALQTMAGSKDPTAASVDTAKAAITAAEETVKAATEQLANLTAAAKDAKAAAKGCADAVKAQEKIIGKAASDLESAQGTLTSFQSGPLAAYTEAEAYAPPPPEPEPVAEVAPAPLEEAMTAAPPAAATQSSPSILPSPGILASRAFQAAGSLFAASPRIAASPGASREF